MKRRVYTTLTKEFIQCIDGHIVENMATADFKPSTSFDIFCNDNMDMLTAEVTQLLKQGLTDAKNIKDKIKKTYQNRYFLVIKK